MCTLSPTLPCDSTHLPWLPEPLHTLVREQDADPGPVGVSNAPEPDSTPVENLATPGLGNPWAQQSLPAPMGFPEGQSGQDRVVCLARVPLPACPSDFPGLLSANGPCLLSAHPP